MSRPDPIAPLGAARGALIAALVGAVTMLSRLWEGDLFRDEVLYAAVAKTIVTGGDWLHLHLGPDPYWNKPPLMFWATALAYRALGTTVFAAKEYFPALCGVGCCVVLYLLARRWVEEPLALLAALVLATTPRFVRTSATFRLDSGVAFFTLLALLFYVRAAERERLRDFLLAGVAWGLGVMAKGAFGLTGPYLFLVYLLVTRRLRLLLTPGFMASVACGALVALPWHLLQVQTFGREFVDVYLGRQVVDRMAGRLWHGPTESYLKALLLDDWLWLAPLVLGIILAARAAWRGDRNLLWVLCWAGAYFALLYVSQGRRARYLFQFYPPAAVLSAVGLGAVLDRFAPARWRTALPRVITRGALAIGFVVLVLPIPIHSATQGSLRDLRPALEAADPGNHDTLPGFRMPSINVRAAFLFYLDRDLHSYHGPRKLPPTGVIVARPSGVSMLEPLGFRTIYANKRFVLMRSATMSRTGQ